MLWSHQVYIIHRSITGFFVVQEAICMHAHEYRLLLLFKCYNVSIKMLSCDWFTASQFAMCSNWSAVMWLPNHSWQGTRSCNNFPTWWAVIGHLCWAVQSGELEWILFSHRFLHCSQNCKKKYIHVVAQSQLTRYEKLQQLSDLVCRDWAPMLGTSIKWPGMGSFFHCLQNC